MTQLAILMFFCGVLLGAALAPWSTIPIALVAIGVVGQALALVLRDGTIAIHDSEEGL